MTPLSASVFWQLFGLTKEANSREASSSCQSSPFCSAFEGLAIPGGGGDAAFAELIFLDLAVLGRRQFLHEFEKARHGKIGQARVGRFDQVRRGEGAAGEKEACGPGRPRHWRRLDGSAAPARPRTMRCFRRGGEWRL